MQVLVDSSVWSLALRRANARGNPEIPLVQPSQAVEILRDLIGDGRAVMIGAIRQEVLSGIKQAEQFKRLQQALAGFEDIALLRTDYELAAEFFNTCRGKGIQGSNIDFLICAAASARELPILSTDQDFIRFAKHLPIKLLAIR